MSIAGNLATMGLQEILQWISLGDKSGTLVLEHAGAERQLVFERGALVGIVPYSGNGLGELERVPEVARRIQSAAERMVGECLFWSSGTFRFLDGARPADLPGGLALDATRLMHLAARRVDEEAVSAQRVAPSTSASLATAPGRDAGTRSIEVTRPAAPPVPLTEAPVAVLEVSADREGEAERGSAAYGLTEHPALEREVEAPVYYSVRGERSRWRGALLVSAISLVAVVSVAAVAALRSPEGSLRTRVAEITPLADPAASRESTAASEVGATDPGSQTPGTPDHAPVLPVADRDEPTRRIDRSRGGDAVGATVGDAPTPPPSPVHAASAPQLGLALRDGADPLGPSDAASAGIARRPAALGQPARGPRPARTELAVDDAPRGGDGLASALPGAPETQTAPPEFTPPRLVENVVPAHPAAAPPTTERVIVDVRVLVGRDGLPIEVRPTGRAAGWGYDEAALEAARTTVWSPARKAGSALETWVTVRYRFAPHARASAEGGP